MAGRWITDPTWSVTEQRALFGVLLRNALRLLVGGQQEQRQDWLPTFVEKLADGDDLHGGIVPA